MENENVPLNSTNQMESTDADCVDDTMESFYPMSYRSPQLNHHGQVLSPSCQSRSYTVREYEEQLDTLRKENFNLKLRIYVLEEKLPELNQIETDEGHESLLKQYLDIKVQEEMLKNDLEEKQELLREAAEAINHLENLQIENDRRNSHIIDELKHRIQILELENRTLEKSGKNDTTTEHESSKGRKNDSLQNSGPDISKFDVCQPSIIKSYEEKLRSLKNQIEKQEEIILKKNNTISELKESVENFKMKNAEIKSVYESKEKSLNLTDTKKLQDELSKCRSEIADKTCELEELNEKLTKKSEDYEKAAKYIEKLLKVTTFMQSEIDSFKNGSETKDETDVKGLSSSKMNTSTENAHKLQQKIDIFSKQISSLRKEVEMKNSSIEKLQGELEEAKAEIDKTTKWGKECSNICSILTGRLEELAGFLNSLLQHKIILSAISIDKKREIQDAVNQSLDLSRSLIMGDSIHSISNISFEESNFLQLSNITSYLETSKCNADFSMTNKVHSEKCNETGENLVLNLKSKLQSFRETRHNESTMQQLKYAVGSLSLPAELLKKTTSTQSFSSSIHKSSKINNELSFKRDSISISKRDEHNLSKIKKQTDKILQYEKLIQEKDNKIFEIQCQLVESDNQLKTQNMLLNEKFNEIESNNNVVKTLQQELEKLKNQLGTIKNQLVNYNNVKLNEEKLQKEIISKNDEIQNLKEENAKLSTEIAELQTLIQKWKNDIQKVKENYENTIKSKEESQVKLLEEIKDDMVKKHNEQLQELEKKYQESLKENWVSLEKYNELLEKKEIIQSELNSCKLMLEELQKSSANLNDKMANNNAEVETMKQNNDDQLTKLIIENDILRTEKLNLEKYVEEIQKNFQTLKIENNLLSEQINAFLVPDEKIKPHLNNVHADVKENYQLADEKISLKNVNDNIDDKDRKVFETDDRMNIVSPDLGIESDTGTIEKNDVNTDSKCEDENKSMQKIESKDQNPENVLSEKDENKENKSILSSNHKCDEIVQENTELKKKYKKLTKIYKELLKQMKTSGSNLEKFERNVKIQLEKTNEVLEYARHNFKSKINLCSESKDV